MWFVSAAHGSEFTRQGNSVVFDALRVQVLAPGLVRLQSADSGLSGGKFDDPVDLGVVNREFPAAAFTIDNQGAAYRIETDALVLDYTPGLDLRNGGITALVKANGTRIARLAEPDTQNLGGVISALDNTMGPKRFAKQNNVGSPSRPIHIPDGLLSRRGWTVLSHAKDVLHPLRAKDRANDLYLFAYGTDYAAAFRDFYRLSGPIPMIPKWALGLYYSRWTDYTAEDYKGIVEGFRSRGLPLDVVVADMNWHVDGWFGYAYDTKNFPDMPAFHAWTDSVHVKTGFNHHSGAVYAGDVRTPEFCRLAGIDFATSQVVGMEFEPETKVVKYDTHNPRHFKAFYDVFVAQLLRDGVDFHWVDGDKTIQSSDNYYRFTKEFTQKRPVVLNRLNDETLANHRYPLGFSGDTYISWETLAFTIEVTLKGANNGVYWSHDIGGYMPQGPAGYEPNAELYARWMQLGAVSPVFRMHAKNPRLWTPRVKPGEFDPGSRKPWEWGPEVLRSAQQSIQLRYKLIPYLYGLTKIAHDTGVPAVGSLYIHYPKVENAYAHPDQLMVGPQILAAPFTKPSGNGLAGNAERSVWLPEGGWFDYYARELVAGGRELTVAKPIDQFPLFIKAGTILPSTPPVAYAMQPTDRMIFEIYPVSSDHTASYRLYEDDGESYGYEKGEFRNTEVSYIYCDGAGYDITIHKPVGSYTAGLEGRAYELVLVRSSPPKTVSVNGRAIAQDSGGWDYKDGNLTIQAGKMTAGEGIRVLVKF